MLENARDAGLDVPGVLGRLLAGAAGALSSGLDEHEAEGLFEAILTGYMDEAQIAGVLSLIAVRGPAIDEIVGAARAMRRHATKVPYDGPRIVLDTCGTGGAPKTFNISTISALVVASAGEGVVRVAKHGNRSRSGRGSAEVLSALGVNVDAAPLVQAECLRRANVCFCFAIRHHPAARHAAGARKSLGFPTIFNLLGPLTNPAGATRQLLGVYDAGAAIKVAHALARLGAAKSWVVHGRDGQDDISTTASTQLADVDNLGARGPGSAGRVEIRELDASTLVPRARPADLVARDLDHAVRIARDVLEGHPGPMRDAVLINSAAALVVGGVSAGLEDGVRRAERALDGGGARAALELLRGVSSSSGSGCG